MILLSQLMPSGIIHEMTLRAAYDHLGETPDYGINNAEVGFVARRANVAVEWSFSSGWFLRRTRERAPLPAMIPRGMTYQNVRAPDGLGSISYHAPVALWPGQEVSHTACKYTHGPCYSDGEFLASGELFDRMVEDPEEIWRELDRRLVETEARVATRANERNFS